MSSIVVACECGQRFKASAELAGRTIPCPVCKRPIKTPLPPPVIASCSCGSQFKAPHSWAGRQVACPTCGKSLTVSHQSAVSTTANESFADLQVDSLASSAPLHLPQQTAVATGPTIHLKTVFTYLGIATAVIVVVGFIGGLYFAFAWWGLPNVKFKQLTREDSSPTDEINRAFGVYDTSAWVEAALPQNSGSIRMPAGDFQHAADDELIWTATTTIPDSPEVYSVEVIRHRWPTSVEGLANRRHITQASDRYQQSMTSERRADYQGLPGWEYVMEATAANGQLLLIQTRVVASPTHLITMTRLGKRELVAADSQAFFSTLRWREPAAP